VSTQLIGRREESSAVARLLDSIATGTSGLVLEGEAGIGKTRLWQHGLEAARARHYRVLSTRPGGAEAQLSFVGLSDLLANDLEVVLARLPDPQRRALEIALLLDEGGAPPDPRSIAVAFLGAVRALADEGPVVIAMDDVQWLDTASAFSIAFALRRLEREPVAVLATVRTAPDQPRCTELADALGERLLRLSVGPLSVSAIYELIRTRLELELRRPLLLRVHDAAGGNPFVALELARALRDAEHEVEPDEPLPVPQGMRELVLARLARLSADARQTLLAAAVLSRPTLELLDQAIPGHVEEDLAAAVDAGLVELEGSRVLFTHPLFASIHYESAPRSRQREMHRRLAAVTVDREERARHLALGSDGPDEKVAGALDSAVAAALSRGALDAAAELATRAVALTSPRSGAGLHRRRLEAARLAFAAGDRLAAQRILDEARAAARTSTERAEILLELGIVHTVEELVTGLSFLRAAADVPVTDARLRASILLRLAPREGYSGAGYERAQELAREAVALAETLGDEELLAKALSTLGFIEHARGLDVPHDLMRRAEAIEQRGEIAVEGGPTALYAEVLAYSGLHDAARERLERIIDVGRETGDAGVCRALFRLAYTEWESGNWDRATELALEAQEIATQSGRETVAPLGAVVLALVEAMRGDVEVGRARALAALGASDRAGRHSGGPRGALALIELTLERYREAYEAMEPALERARRVGSDLPATQDSDAIEALANGGRIEEARALLEPFDEAARRLGLPFLLAAAARCHGLIALAEDDLEVAEAALEEAVAAGEEAKMPLELGRSLVVLGSVRRRSHEKRAARLALERALEIFEQLGATVWAERARRELGRIGGRAAPRAELSATEAQIVDLVIAGRSNKEVARSLHLSPKTVEWNLSKVYRKLGVRSRTELAAVRGARH
jgi:DNA-binding CsgD family transcriptional regulator